jgi:hypothetical protein
VFVLVTLAHVAFFAWIGLRTPFSQMRVMDEPRVVEAWLVPPIPPQPRPEPTEDASSRRPPSTATPYRPRLVIPVAPTEVAPIPAPPAPAPAPAGPRASAPQFPPEWNGLRGALRGSDVGCGNRDRVGLTAAERDACNEKQGLASRNAKMLGLGIEAGKQGRFDQTAAEKARVRRSRQGSMTQPMVGCTGVGSNFGVGCNPP